MDFTDPNPAMKWYYFESDLAIGKAKDAEYTGMFSMKLHFHEITNSNN